MLQCSVTHFGVPTTAPLIGRPLLDSARRHKRDIIGHALETFALPAPRSLMIGDRAEGVLGARPRLPPVLR